MKIISWNVNGLRSVVRKGFFEWIKKENPDILCLQEIKIKESDLTFDLLYPSGYFAFYNSAVKKGYSGTAVFAKEKPKSINKKLSFRKFNDEGRFLELNFSNFTLINTYIPHGSRDKKNLKYKLKAYDSLTEKLSSLSEKPLVLCGDFNIAHKKIDLARPENNLNNIMFTPEERACLDKLADLDFSDTFREFNKRGGNYTWWPYRANARKRNLGWRIDYIFISKSLKGDLVKAFILKDVWGSDHCPIGITIDV